MRKLLPLVIALFVGATAAASPVKDVAMPMNALGAPSGNQIARVNVLITEAQAALTDRDWALAEHKLDQILEVVPRDWTFQAALGNVRHNQGKYQEAVEAYARTLTLIAMDRLTKQERDEATSKTLMNQGNSYLGMKNPDAAIAVYSRAAQLLAHPADAYFNVCATLYNKGEKTRALPACDKALAADPTRADTYFIRGVILYGTGMVSSNHYMVPPGTVEALHRYLELAPQGAHAPTARAILKTLEPNQDPDVGPVQEATARL